MYNHSFRNKVATGQFTLPVTMIITLLGWVMPDPGSVLLWIGAAVTGISAYLIVELNNRNTLLRIRSRMMSSTFLVLMLVCPALHVWQKEMLIVPLFLLSYFVLFASYQKVRPEGEIFHAFLFQGLASLIFPPMLVVCLGYYISMMFQLRNFTFRTFAAGLLGALLPYWFYAAFSLWNGTIDTAFVYLYDWFLPRIPDYSVVSRDQWITLGVIGFFSLTAFIHFFRTAYDDKIRTRMLFYVLATQQILIILGIVLLPQCFEEEMRLLIVNSAFFIAHHFALARGRMMDVWFVVSLMLLVAFGTYNIWNM